MKPCGNINEVWMHPLKESTKTHLKTELRVELGGVTNFKCKYLLSSSSLKCMQIFVAKQFRSILIFFSSSSLAYLLAVQSYICKTKDHSITFYSNQENIFLVQIFIKRVDPLVIIRKFNSTQKNGINESEWQQVVPTNVFFFFEKRRRDRKRERLYSKV